MTQPTEQPGQALNWCTQGYDRSVGQGSDGFGRQRATERDSGQSFNGAMLNTAQEGSSAVFAC